MHEDDAKLGKVVTEDDLRRRYADAKEMGCNFVRLAHYPHHERAVELADEAGLLVWAEIPVTDLDRARDLRHVERVAALERKQP